MKQIMFATLAVAAVFGASSVLADEVVFKSGDKLTGTVKSVDGGTMVFDSKVAGTINLKMADIKTFKTDAPITVVGPEGGVLREAAAPSATEGKVKLGTTEVALSDMAKVNPPDVKWTGKVTAGAQFVRGNTDTSAASLGFDAARRSEDFRLSALGAYYYEKQRTDGTDSEVANNWFLKGQADYFLTEKNYLYAQMKWEKDLVAHLKARATPGAGYGYQWFETADFNLNTEAGVSWTYERYVDPNEERRYMAGRLAYHVDKTLWSKLKLYHNLEWLPSFERLDMYLINADAGFQAPISDRLALDGKVVLAYNSTPAAGREDLDTRYIFGLSWLF